MWFVTLKDEVGTIVFYGQTRSILTVVEWHSDLLGGFKDEWEMTTYRELGVVDLSEGFIDNRE